MSVSQLSRAPSSMLQKAARGGGGSGEKSAAAGAASLASLQSSDAHSSDLQSGMGNSFLTQSLLEGAVEKVVAEDGSSFLKGFTLGLDETGKYDFAEDGDDLTQDTAKRATQQEDLPGLRPKHEDKEYEDFTNGAAFVKGAGDEQAVDANDVKQGALGDCYLMAAMAATARANPKLIEDLIKDNGDGTYDVTLFIRSSPYARPRKVTKTVDSRLPTKYSGTALYAKTGDEANGETELWTALIEKTVAQHKGSYDLISGGNISKQGFEFHGATELLTGKRENYYRLSALDEDDLLLLAEYALEESNTITLDSKNMKDDPDMTSEANAVNVYGNHAYAVRSVDLDGRTVTLQNPWGSSHVENLPIEKAMKYYRGMRIGG